MSSGCQIAALKDISTVNGYAGPAGKNPDKAWCQIKIPSASKQPYLALLTTQYRLYLFFSVILHKSSIIYL